MTDNELHNLELHVKDFGPIRDANDIKIRPMTVFVGPSNTGKSYLAILVHAVSQALNETSNLRNPSDDTEQYERDEDLYNALFADILDSYNNGYNQTNFIGLDPDSIRSASKSLINRIEWDAGIKISDALTDSVASFFEEGDFSKLSTNTRGDFDVQIADADYNWSFAIDDSEFYYIGRSQLLDGIPDAQFAHIKFPVDLVSKIMGGDYFISNKLSIFEKMQINRHVKSSYLNLYSNIPASTYFPASRTGIIAAHRLLNRSIIIKEYQENNVKSRNRIILEFLDHLLALGDNIRDRDPKAIQLAEVLEQSLVNGQIKVQHNQYGLPEFTYSSEDIDIPISRSSAMVTELAPIILFLKGFINIGDLLIIEEPEAHLHPAAQQKMAAALALMVRNGLRVLITTHSHYMVEQISNFVGASFLSSEKRQDLLNLDFPMNNFDVYLDESEVSMYGFDIDDSSGRTEVKPIPFDDAYAYVPEDHSVALNEQFNRNIRIIRARQNGHNGSVNGL